MTSVVLDEVPPANTPEWVAWRRGGLGASEIAATFGEHPWTTERSLALLKRGLVPDVTETPAMSWGHRMEQVGAEEYAARTGLELVAGVTFGDPRWPHLYASPDRVASDRLVELKWTDRWETPPRHVRIQALAQLGLSGRERVDVVRMGPYGEPQWTTIERDEDEIVSLLDWGEEWYCRYALGDELPPEDGSPASRRYAESRLASGHRDATDYEAALMERIRVARQDKAAAETAELTARGLLTASMAGFDSVEGPGFKAAFRPVKGRTTTAWQAVADAYRALLTERGVPADELETLVGQHTTTGDPSRQFRPEWF